MRASANSHGATLKMLKKDKCSHEKTFFIIDTNNSKPMHVSSLWLRFGVGIMLGTWFRSFSSADVWAWATIGQTTAASWRHPGGKIRVGTGGGGRPRDVWDKQEGETRRTSRRGHHSRPTGARLPISDLLVRNLALSSTCPIIHGYSRLFTAGSLLLKH